MQRQDLTATSWAASRLTAVALVFAGILFLFRPDALGWGALSRWAGGDVNLIAAGVGCGFLVLAALSLEKHQIRVRTAELVEGLNQLLYGKDYARDREAIELLVRALEGADPDARATAHRHLVRLTSQNFAADPRVWRAWWAANERTWAARADAPGAAPPPPESRRP